MQFHCGQYTLDLTYPKVMGIVNVTPDSFSDGGQYAQTEQAVAHALSLVEAGADILDIGGESTRPNALPVPLHEELSRVIPVIEALASQVNIPISIDTYKPEVMSAAIHAGASMVNDVNALQAEGALQLLANRDAGICLMHMRGTPQTMQSLADYDDVVAEVHAFLSARLDACLQLGIQKERILLDPGFGFAKRTQHNIDLLKHLSKLTEMGLPLLVGLSRKAILGQLVGNDVNKRLNAGIAASVLSVMKGAKIVRVHDVKATVEALKVVAAVM